MSENQGCLDMYTLTETVCFEHFTPLSSVVAENTVYILKQQ